MRAACFGGGAKAPLISGIGITKIKEDACPPNTRKCLPLPYSRTRHKGQKPLCWGLEGTVGGRRNNGRAVGSPGQTRAVKVAGAQSRAAGWPRITRGGWGRIGGLPRPLPSRGGRGPRAVVTPSESRGRSRISRSRFLPPGSACRGQTSLPGSQHSPPRSPQPNIPANSGRWPEPPAPAPTPSSLLLLPSADAATAAPRAAASPQPRRPISPPLPQAVGPGSSRRRRVEKTGG